MATEEYWYSMCPLTAGSLHLQQREMPFDDPVRGHYVEQTPLHQLLEWTLGSACALHDGQNALKWALFPVTVTRPTDDLHIVVQSLKNSFASLHSHIHSFVRRHLMAASSKRSEEEVRQCWILVKSRAMQAGRIPKLPMEALLWSAGGEDPRVAQALPDDHLTPYLPARAVALDMLSDPGIATLPQMDALLDRNIASLLSLDRTFKLEKTLAQRAAMVLDERLLEHGVKLLPRATQRITMRSSLHSFSVFLKSARAAQGPASAIAKLESVLRMIDHTIPPEIYTVSQQFFGSYFPYAVTVPEFSRIICLYSYSSFFSVIIFIYRSSVYRHTRPSPNSSLFSCPCMSVSEQVPCPQKSNTSRCRAKKSEWEKNSTSGRKASKIPGKTTLVGAE